MIQVQAIDGLLLREMVLSGAALLEKNREAVDALPEKERMTILLRFFRGFTQEQTARVLKVSQVQVSRLERRGLERLRRTMEP